MEQKYTIEEFVKLFNECDEEACKVNPIWSFYYMDEDERGFTILVKRPTVCIGGVHNDCSK